MVAFNLGILLFWQRKVQRFRMKFCAMIVACNELTIFLIWVCVQICLVLFGAGDASSMFQVPLNNSIDGLYSFKKKDSKLRISILTMGSRGDVQPFIALALEMQKHSHVQVVICTMDSYKELVERYGLGFRSVGVKDLAFNQAANKRIWRDSEHVSQVVTKLQEGIAHHYDTIAHNMLAACEGCDIIIATAVTSGYGLNIAEHLHVPCWLVKLSPDSPTRAFAPAGKTSSPIGFLNLMMWYHSWFKIFVAAAGSRKRDNPEEGFRKQLGIGPLGGGKRIRQMQNTPTLCAFSSSIVPKPADYPVSCFVTGFWFLESDVIDSHSQLDSFVGESKPACINFGSMTEVAKDFGLIEKLLESISIAKLSCNKVVIVDPYINDEMQTCDNFPNLDIFILKEIPHELIFPKCSLVIHHGGAGTSARVLEFGVPSLIIPIMIWTDQPLWADIFQQMNCAVHVDRRVDEFVIHAAEATKQLIDNPLFSNASKLVARKIESEASGIQVAANLILESTFSK